MSLVLGIAFTNRAMIISDGRVTSAKTNLIVDEKFDKTRKINNNVILGFSGETELVKEFLITSTLSPQEMAYTYASEADILNMALFGKTAAQWRNEKGISGKTLNIRDFASAEELVVLINLEGTNANLIRLRST